MISDHQEDILNLLVFCISQTLRDMESILQLNITQLSCIIFQYKKCFKK